MTQQRYPTDLTEAQWAQLTALLPPPGGGSHCTTSSGCSSMPSCACCGVVAPGACSPMTFRPGRRSTITAARSASTAPGRRRPGPSSALASRSRRPKKGRPRLRWGQARDRTPVTTAGGYPGLHAERRGTSGRYSGSGRGLRGAAPALGSGTDLRLAGPLPALEQGL